jgi:hypothetical protein
MRKRRVVIGSQQTQYAFAAVMKKVLCKLLLRAPQIHVKQTKRDLERCRQSRRRSGREPCARPRVCQSLQATRCHCGCCSSVSRRRSEGHYRLVRLSLAPASERNCVQVHSFPPPSGNRWANRPATCSHTFPEEEGNSAAPVNECFPRISWKLSHSRFKVAQHVQHLTNYLS